MAPNLKIRGGAGKVWFMGGLRELGGLARSAGGFEVQVCGFEWGGGIVESERLSDPNKFPQTPPMPPNDTQSHKPFLGPVLLVFTNPRA